MDLSLTVVDLKLLAVKFRSIAELFRVADGDFAFQIFYLTTSLLVAIRAQIRRIFLDGYGVLVVRTPKKLLPEQVERDQQLLLEVLQRLLALCCSNFFTLPPGILNETPTTSNNHGSKHVFGIYRYFEVEQSPFSKLSDLSPHEYDSAAGPLDIRASPSALSTLVVGMYQTWSSGSKLSPFFKYWLWIRRTALTLPPEETTALTLPPEETCCSLSLEETDCSLPPEETDCSLPLEETCYFLPP
ncbi:hypothetical protein Tco_1407906 [Tanacetum coccineum]